MYKRQGFVIFGGAVLVRKVLDLEALRPPGSAGDFGNARRAGRCIGMLDHYSQRKSLRERKKQTAATPARTRRLVLTEEMVPPSHTAFIALTT